MNPRVRLQATQRASEATITPVARGRGDSETPATAGRAAAEEAARARPLRVVAARRGTSPREFGKSGAFRRMSINTDVSKTTVIRGRRRSISWAVSLARDGGERDRAIYMPVRIVRESAVRLSWRGAVTRAQSRKSRGLRPPG